MVTFVTDMDSDLRYRDFLNLLHCFKFKLDIFMRKKIESLCFQNCV